MSAAWYTNKVRVQAVAKNTKVEYPGGVAQPIKPVYSSSNCNPNYSVLKYFKPNCNPISNIPSSITICQQ